MPLFREIKLSQLKDYLIFLDIDGTLIHDNESQLDKLIIEKAKAELEALEKVIELNDSAKALYID